MSLATWVETAISTQHDRKRFDCGDAELNIYLQRYARQNHASGGAKCFIAAAREEPSRILGFYTLSPGEVAYARTPDVIRKSLGRYAVPVYRLGRLAIDRTLQGQGLGGRLLLAAGERAVLVAAQAGGVALLIDAKSARAAAWYAGFGALPMKDAPLSLLLFGSRARGEARPDSDYDVGVFLRGLHDFDREARTLAEIETDILITTGAVVHALPLTAGSQDDRTGLMQELRRDGREL